MVKLILQDKEGTIPRVGYLRQWEGGGRWADVISKTGRKGVTTNADILEIWLWKKHASTSAVFFFLLRVIWDKINSKEWGGRALLMVWGQRSTHEIVLLKNGMTSTWGGHMMVRHCWVSMRCMAMNLMWDKSEYCVFLRLCSVAWVQVTMRWVDGFSHSWSSSRWL